MAKKKSSFWQDFKKFITRGNVVDMAVGVVIGKAFGNIVTGLVNYIINPFIGIFMKAGSLDDIKTVITPEKLDETGAVVQKEVALLWGTWFQTILDFLIVALCIFTVLRILMRAKNVIDAEKIAAEEKKAAEEKAKAEAEEAATKEKAEALAARQTQLEEAVLHQEKLLAEMCEIMKKNK